MKQFKVCLGKQFHQFWGNCCRHIKDLLYDIVYILICIINQ